MKTQYGTASGADFLHNEWSFEMEESFTVSGGKFAIIPLETLQDISLRVSNTINAIGNNAELQHVKDDMRFILDKF